MTDITWRDTYGDAEGLACTLDIWSRVFAKQGNYGQATDMSAAATALREQAERVAELEAQLATARAEGEQRVLREFAEWCDQNANAPRPRFVDTYRTGAALAINYAKHQRAQAKQGESNG